MSLQYRLASVAAGLSSTGISHHSLLPHIPSIRLSTVNSSPRPGIAPQSPNFSSQPLHLPGDLCPCLGYVWLRQGFLILIPFKLPQISCFTLSLKCFSSYSHSCPDMGIGPLLQFLSAAGPGLLTLLFFPLVPSSFQVKVLLSTLSWCSACTSVSEGVFLMYPWRCTPRLFLLHHLVPTLLFYATRFFVFILCNPFFFSIYFYSLEANYFTIL